MSASGLELENRILRTNTVMWALVEFPLYWNDFAIARLEHHQFSLMFIQKLKELPYKPSVIEGHKYSSKNQAVQQRSK